MDRGAWWATARRVTESQTRLKQLSMQAQSLFNTWCWDNWISTFQRMNLDSYHSPHTKNNSKWIKYLNVSIETMNLLEENIGEYLWPSVKQWFLKYDLKVQATCFKRHHQESKKTTHRMKKYFHGGYWGPLQKICTGYSPICSAYGFSKVLTMVHP